MFKYKNSILVLMNDSQVEKYKGKGLTGLANLGNTCFINSCMQILSHTYMLNDFLDKEDYKKKLNKKPESVLLMEWDKLRTLMWSENCTINPAGWVQAVQKIARIKGRDLFTGFAQNDLPEFLLFIIDSFHSALMREVEMNIKGTAQNSTDKLAKECYEMMKNMYKKEYSEILGIFYGIHVSQIASLDGKEIKSYSPEPYLWLTWLLISIQVKHYHYMIVLTTTMIQKNWKVIMDGLTKKQTRKRMLQKGLFSGVSLKCWLLL